VEIFHTLRFLLCSCFLSREERDSGGGAGDDDDFEAMSEEHIRMDSGEDGFGIVSRSPDTTFVGARNRLSDYESTLMTIPGDRLSQVGIAK
jgi:hypothetical protein